MGGLLFKSCIGRNEYITLSTPHDEEDLQQERPLRRRPKRRSKCDRPKVPKLVLYDVEESRMVEGHESVRRLLLRIPGWVPQRPINGFIEYWYYFTREGQPLTPSTLLYPAARAILPWPCLYNSSPEMLENFACVVNRIAHRQLVSLLSSVNKTPYGRLQKRNLRIKVLARVLAKAKRLQQFESMKRGRWRPMSLVTYVSFMLRNRKHRKDDYDHQSQTSR